MVLYNPQGIYIVHKFSISTPHTEIIRIAALKCSLSIIIITVSGNFVIISTNTHTFLQTEFGQRHRYSVLLQELSQTAKFPECQATVMAFINYLLSSCENLQQRIRLRSELNGELVVNNVDLLGKLLHK